MIDINTWVWYPSACMERRRVAQPLLLGAKQYGCLGMSMYSQSFGSGVDAGGYCSVIIAATYANIWARDIGSQYWGL